MSEGCHNCEFAGKEFESYETSPCAKCRTKEPPSLLSGVSWSDLSYSEKYSSMHPAYKIEKEVHNEMLSALGKCVFELVDLREKHPETFKFAITKMKHPGMSYSDIAKKFDCKKQNVMYHLKKAVQVCEYLKHAILINKRYNRNGQN